MEIYGIYIYRENQKEIHAEYGNTWNMLSRIWNILSMFRFVLSWNTMEYRGIHAIPFKVPSGSLAVRPLKEAIIGENSCSNPKNLTESVSVTGW